MAIVDSILMEMDQEAKTTARVLERIPQDKLGWKPHAKSYSLGQLGLHIARGQGFLSDAVSKDTFEIGDMSQPDPTSVKEILDTFAQSTAHAKDTLAKLDDGKLMAMWTATRKGKVLMSVPRIGFIRAIVLNHFYHHRGQLSVYLRLLDVPVPSIYGPSADENPFG
ncbi:MAG TPA: DinB family protein [Candidatus Acidoferrales bacterium]|nr:DinB family protein [Candidatus Acidoferrales bacterium]